MKAALAALGIVLCACDPPSPILVDLFTTEPQLLFSTNPLPPTWSCSYDLVFRVGGGERVREHVDMIDGRVDITFRDGGDDSTPISTAQIEQWFGRKRWVSGELAHATRTHVGSQPLRANLRYTIRYMDEAMHVDSASTEVRCFIDR